MQEKNYGKVHQVWYCGLMEKSFVQQATGELFIDPQKIRVLSSRCGIKNARELSKLTGVDYNPCYKLWSGERLKSNLQTLTRFLERLNLIQEGIPRYEALLSYEKGKD